MDLSQSPIEFTVSPSLVKVSANSTGILNVVSKLKNSYQLASARDTTEQQDGKKKKSEKYTHLLIGKVKDTQVMFSFIIDASLLEASTEKSFSWI